MPNVCMYCVKDLSKTVQLDFTREIVCGDCVQKLVGSSALPQKSPKLQPKHKKLIPRLRPIKKQEMN